MSAPDDKEHRRSMLFSILKCEYGWNGCYSDSTGDLDAMALTGIEAGECNDCIAAKMADAIARTCPPEYFRKRIDGRPNRRIAVIGGSA